MEYHTIVHTIPPIYQENSRILILGSMPSPKSREQGFFYGHPQNRFWRVLACVLQQEIPRTIAEKKALLLNNGIALWDVLQSCEIRGASDQSIRHPVVNDFSPIFKVANIQAIFTTGVTAHRLFCTLTGKDSILLPSPSPANCRVSFDRLVQAYSAILPYLDREIKEKR